MLGPTTAVLLTEFVLKPLVWPTLDGGLALPSRTHHQHHRDGVGGRAGVRRWRGPVVLALASVVGLAGSMVALDAHYATDTVAGALVATASLGTVALLDGQPQRN